MRSKWLIKCVIVCLMLVNLSSASVAEVRVSVAPEGDSGQIQDYFPAQGNAGIQTIGQTFKTPQGHNQLNSFSLWLSDSPFQTPDPLKFHAYLMEWEGHDATGDYLYKSPVTITSGLAHGERREFIFDQIDVLLSPEKQYIFFISCSEFFGGDPSMAFMGSSLGNYYTDGKRFDLRNGSDTSKFTNGYWTSYAPYDLAFTATFNVPEPATLSLLALGGFLLRKRK